MEIESAIEGFAVKLENGFEELNKLFTSGDYFSILSIVRRLDAMNLHLSVGNAEQKTDNIKLSSLVDFGWGRLLKIAYESFEKCSEGPFFISSEEIVNWANELLILSGKLSLAQQTVAICKANLLDVVYVSESTLECAPRQDMINVDLFEWISADFYRRKIVERAIAEKVKESPGLMSHKTIRKELKKIVQNPFGIAISYHATPEVEHFYNKQGYFHLLRLQGHEDFGDDDLFGSIKYSKYVDIVEQLMAHALMHLDACIELKRKNPKVDIHNILSYVWNEDAVISQFADHNNTSFEEMREILSCLTLNRDNFASYLSVPGAVPPPYIKVSDSQIVRSVVGCLENPFQMLNFQLKRRFKREYDQAVNNREARFRNDLYTFFSDDRYVKLSSGVNINVSGRCTDIDAIVFDKQTHTLGLFQLKWQDPFSHSMKERYSRISNLYPKAIEWIDKVSDWLGSKKVAEIARTFRLPKGNSGYEINKCYLFVVSRHQVNFSNVEIDPRAAWASWYQLIEAYASVRTNFDDPIRSLFEKVIMFTPEERIKREGTLATEPFEINVMGQKIIFRGNSV